jgi:branched-chain amino acid transport system permease protein
MAIVLQIIWNAILAGLLYSLVAGALSLVYATTKIFHFAHGAVVLAGGYATWYFAVSLHLPFVVAAVLACFLSGVIGLIMNEVVYEPLRRRGAKGVSFLIASLALLTFGTGFILMLFGAIPKIFPYSGTVYTILGANVTDIQVYIAAIAIVFLSLFYLLTYRTRFGKAMRATADNETVAEVLGIDTIAVRRRAFFVASVLGGIAGLLVGLQFNIDPTMGTLLVIRGFAGAVIGGVGSFSGSMLGSFTVGGAEQGIVWFLGSGWRNAITFVLLFVFLLVRPQGFFGPKRDI